MKKYSAKRRDYEYDDMTSNLESSNQPSPLNSQYPIHKKHGQERKNKRKIEKDEDEQESSGSEIYKPKEKSRSYRSHNTHSPSYQENYNRTKKKTKQYSDSDEEYETYRSKKEDIQRVKKDFADLEKRKKRQQMYLKEFQKQNQEIDFQHNPSIQASQSNFTSFASSFYPNKYNSGGMQNAQQMNKLFEPQLLKTQKGGQNQLRKNKINDEEFLDEGLEEWEAKPTREGVHQWIKRYDDKGKKFWQNIETKHIQFVKPDSETYLIQAAILGNIAFLEVYIRQRGFLALHHSVSNGHKQFTILLCEFGTLDGLLESEDLTGCTPLFCAVRYNESECLKVLLAYECNVYHKKKSGETCLHEAASFNSLECMVTVANFGGMDLFSIRNRQGQRAIDIAERMGNYECYQALQKLQRNLGIHTSIVERELLNQKQSKRSQLSMNSQLTMSRGNSKVKDKKKLKIIKEEESEEDASNSQNSELGQLGGRDGKIQRLNRLEGEARAQEHMNQYMRKVKEEKKGKKKQKKNETPKFVDYEELKRRKLRRQRKMNKQNMVQSEESERLEFEQQRKKGKSSRIMRNRDTILEDDSESISRENQYDPSQNRELQKSRSYFHLSIRDDSIQNSRLRQVRTARDMYILNNLSDSYDDEEMQRKTKKRPKSQRQNQTDQLLDRGSLIEKAYERTSSFLKNIAWFMKSKFNSLKDYVWQDEQNSDDNYATPHSKSRSTSRRQPRIGSVPTNPYNPQAHNHFQMRAIHEQSSEDNEQSFGQRPKKKIRKNKKKNDNMMLESLQVQIEEEKKEVEKKNISIQADNQGISKKSTQVNSHKKDSFQSTKSVGVGSMNINESVNQTKLSMSSQNQSHKNQQHSRMIQMERKKRLGKQSKKLLNKNYLSSEDERARKPLPSPSPAPRYLKEEIEQIKMVSNFPSPNEFEGGFIQVDVKQVVDQQLDKLDEQQLYTQSQRELLKKNAESTMNLVNNQRYQKTQYSLSRSSNNGSENNINQLTSQNKQAQSLRNLDQYAKTNQNSNKKYQIDQPILDTPQKINQQVDQAKDIKKFYDDLLKNTSITQIEGKEANISGTIDESNLSALYQKVMNKNQKTSTKRIDYKQEMIEEEKLVFNVNEIEWDENTIQFYEPERETLSLIQDMAELDLISVDSNTKIELIKQNSQMQSNYLDKAQYLQNSCNSTYNQRQNTSIQKPLGMLLQNNSMQTFNIQYQSDNEADIALKRQSMISPLKKRTNQNLIPPLSIKQQSFLQVSQAKGHQTEDSARQSNQNKTQEQRMMIELFKEDAENDNLAPTLAQELQIQQNYLEIQGAPPLAQFSNSNSIIMEDQVENPHLYVDTQNDYKPEESYVPRNPKRQSIVLSTEKSLKNQKQNNRYEQEDSLINFDVTSSKISSEKLNNSEEKDLQEEKLPEEILSQSNISSGIMELIEKQLTRKIESKIVLEAQVLPLQTLKAAYNPNQIQNWQGEEDCLLDQALIQKTLLGNVIAEVFTGKKKIKRKIIPYHAGEMKNIKKKKEEATAQGIKQREIEEENKSQQMNKSYNNASQDSIIQDFETISKIYNELETVQEEDQTEEPSKEQLEKTQSQIQKQHQRQIPKQQQYVDSPVIKNKSQQKTVPRPDNPNIFYQSGLKERKNSIHSNNEGSDADQKAQLVENEENPLSKYYYGSMGEKFNRSTAIAQLNNLYTSSEDESKRKTGNFSRARPRQNKMLHSSSVNPPLYQQKKTVKDISFKSSNVSTHTDQSERLKENLKAFQKNKLGIKKSGSKETLMNNLIEDKKE